MRLLSQVTQAEIDAIFSEVEQALGADKANALRAWADGGAKCNVSYYTDDENVIIHVLSRSEMELEAAVKGPQ